MHHAEGRGAMVVVNRRLHQNPPPRSPSEGFWCNRDFSTIVQQWLQVDPESATNPLSTDRLQKKKVPTFATIPVLQPEWERILPDEDWINSLNHANPRRWRPRSKHTRRGDKRDRSERSNTNLSAKELPKTRGRKKSPRGRQGKRLGGDSLALRAVATVNHHDPE